MYLGLLLTNNIKLIVRRQFMSNDMITFLIILGTLTCMWIVVMAIISMIEFLIDGNVHRVVRGVKLLLRYSLIRLGGVDGEEAHRILLGK